MPKWYQYSQNNSGGAYLGPAVGVYIEAESAEHADERAQEVGIYFGGVESGRDCECCGGRWSRATYWGLDAHQKNLCRLLNGTAIAVKAAGFLRGGRPKTPNVSGGSL